MKCCMTHGSDGYINCNPVGNWHGHSIILPFFAYSMMIVFNCSLVSVSKSYIISSIFCFVACGFISSFINPYMVLLMALNQWKVVGSPFFYHLYFLFLVFLHLRQYPHYVFFPNKCSRGDFIPSLISQILFFLLFFPLHKKIFIYSKFINLINAMYIWHLSCFILG